MPKTTLASLNENKASGFKVSKERATVLLCVNSTGSHKLIPLFIGKYKNPRIFKNCKLHLPLIYKSNLSSWMTKTIFEEWFHKSFVPSVQEHLRSLNLPPKALLLLDNAPAHCKNMISNDGQIKTKFLPSNITSILQPMDQSIIASFKCIYRKLFLTLPPLLSIEHFYDNFPLFYTFYYILNSEKNSFNK